MTLPIDAAVPAILEALRTRQTAVVVAPPGSGKTTRLPLALREAGLLARGALWLLQPRRVAARAAARRMAFLLGEDVGRTVGYATRDEVRSSKDTRILVVTEGILTRRIHEDPSLAGIAAVMLDEFHERSRHADLALAFLSEVRGALREDLLLLVASATLDAGPVAAYLGEAPVVSSDGGLFPVDVRWAERRDARPIEARMAETIRRALAETRGDVLAFLPGAREIRRTSEALGEVPSVRVAPLHGDLSAEDQDRALAPGGSRKVILATNIAETSLTIEGVTAVVDSGLARVLRLDPRSGLDRLTLSRISKASATQRAGRAGRLGPGVCYRLHTREEERGVVDFEEPEILRTDATPALLDVLLWSGRDPALFPWFEAPGSAALSTASALLRRMGALAETGWALTEKGRAIARMPVSPRLAATVLAASEQGRGAEGALLAALVEERDVKRRTFGTGRARDTGGPEPAVNVEDRAVEVREAGKGSAPEFDRGALLRVFRLRDRLSRQVPGTRARTESRPALLAGFPDRVARVDVSRGEVVLEGGRRLAFRPEHEAGAPLILVLDTAGGETSPERVTLFAPLAIGDLPSTREEVAVFWDSESLSVRAEKRLVFGALTLDERPVPAPANEAATELLAKAALERGLRDFTNLADLERLEARLAFLGRALPEVSFTEISRETLLREAARGKRRLDELAKSRLDELLLESLTWEERRLLSAEAPEAITVPSGRSHAVDYTADGPVLAVKLQELFGLAETPRLARGRVPVILHLLSPARRPVQVTRDLRSFWSTTYHEVRKELRGRYPKHPWPEDPWNAPATHRATARPRPPG